MRQKPPEWITFYAVEGQSRSHYRSSWSTRGTGQVATRCLHPSHGNAPEGHLVSVDTTYALAALKGAAHSATHQPTSEAS